MHQLRAFAPAVFVTSLLLLNETATCFHTKLCGGGRRARYNSHEASPEIATTNNDASWDEGIRQEATDVLLPVFFPKHDCNSTSRKKPITAETSLKKLLRKKYQHQKHHDSSQLQHQNRTANESRGRLAALVLGTSVMRLRHWCIALSQNNMLRHGTKVPIPYPLDSSLLSLIPKNNISADDNGGSLSQDPTSDSSENDKYSIEERYIVGAMVDEQAHYLSTANPTTPSLKPNSGIDKATHLSIRYSLPQFLTSSLLSQYGYNETNKLCGLMNNPGPITIRRNAIRFAGPDEKLCKLLWEEDGIHAKPLSILLGGGENAQFQHSTEPVMTVSADGSSRYVMGSLSTSGSVMPAEGTIQILPPRTNATTLVEQRRSNKSIWSMKGWQNGYFEVQDAGSQLIVQSVEVSPGDSILDYCGGNGGKTFALASAVMNTAAKSTSKNATKVLHSQIVAHDVVEERLRQIQGSLSRVGFIAEEGYDAFGGVIHTAKSSLGDCKCTIQTATSSDLEAANKHKGSFDAVLVDAPCSSTGVLRRRPSQRWDLTEKQSFEVLPDLQLEILKNASSFVNEKGGKLVYSTCSLLREENEDVVRKFERSSVFLNEGFERWEFVPQADDTEVSEENPHTLTLIPSETGSDGFFIARWKRGKNM